MFLSPAARLTGQKGKPWREDYESKPSGPQSPLGVNSEVRHRPAGNERPFQVSDKTRPFWLFFDYRGIVLPLLRTSGLWMNVPPPASISFLAASKPLALVGRVAS
jgi:hypothetical protein